MNWTQLIAEFPQSILQNELPLEVMAVLERAGLSTEEDLIAQIKKKPQDVRKAILNLKINRCIEYGQNYIKLTSRGKNLLDRFGLQDSIVEDVLDTLNIMGKERDDCKILLSDYRDEAFDYYLNSLSSLRIWEFIAKSASSKLSKKDLYENQVGMLTLLLRDLRNWYMHTRPSNDPLNEINENIKIILLNKLSENVTYTLIFDDDKFSSCRLLLDNLESKPLKSSQKKDLGIGSEKVFLLINFHTFQAASKPDRWFDVFLNEKSSWQEGSKNKNIRLFINHLIKNVELENINQNSKISANEKPLTTYQQNWTINNLRKKPSDNLIDHIITSKDLTELAIRSGLEISYLKILLPEISDKCNQLLEVSEIIDAPNSYKIDG